MASRSCVTALMVVRLAGGVAPSRAARLARPHRTGIAASLAWSIHLTASTRPPPTSRRAARTWELGAGALIAIGLPWIVRVPARPRAALTWVGLAGILARVAGVRRRARLSPASRCCCPSPPTGLVVAGGAHRDRRAGAGPHSWSPAAPARRRPLVCVRSLALAPAGDRGPVRWPPSLRAPEPPAPRRAFGLSYLTYRVYENPLRHLAG